ncbi:MAG: hypothetical protein NTV84_04325 [Methanoregula sp.]|nr:hypothetical protein [Methanoregula sp.]
MKTRAFTFGSDAVVQSTCRVQVPIISHDIKDPKGTAHADLRQEPEIYPCWNRTWSGVLMGLFLS